MAKKPVVAAQPTEEPTLRTTVSDADAQLDARAKVGQEIVNRQVRNRDELESAQNDWYTWGEYNEKLLLKLFTTSTIRDEYKNTISVFAITAPNLPQDLKEFRDNVSRDLRFLHSLRERLSLYAPVSDASIPLKEAAQKEFSRRVFIVHGRDDSSKTEVARLLERLQFEAVILHEQPSQGRTIIEKFETHSDVGFAVVLLTPDDVGGLAGSPPNLQPRARQNVVFELGFFVGKLGRDRVVALRRDVIEQPSDIGGVVYTTLDASGAWKLELAKELKAAGYDVDFHRIP